MTFFEALPLAKDKTSLIGTCINGDKIDDILIVPTNPDELKSYIDLYISTKNAQQAIAPFMASDVKVVALFKRENLIKLGVMATIDL